MKHGLTGKTGGSITAGISGLRTSQIRVDSDIPFTEKTFDPKFEKFETDGPSEEMISLRHHFSLPEFNRDDLGQEVYRRAPWAIYRKDRSWIYLGIGPGQRDKDFHCAAVFNEDHTRGRIYNPSEALFRQGKLHALTMFPSDQILLARALAGRQACFLHAAGMDINGKGLLLVGHSDAGKTTAARMLRKHGEVLCDDRIIVRRQAGRVAHPRDLEPWRPGGRFRRLRPAFRHPLPGKSPC